MSLEPEQVKAAVTSPGGDASPAQKKFRLFRWLVKLTARLIFSVIVLLAIYVTVGRLAMGMLTYRADAVAAQASRALDMDVSIAGLEGHWSLFSPVLDVQGLRFTAAQTAQPHTHSVARAQLKLDAFASLRARKPVVTSISITAMDIALQQNTNGGWTLAGLAGGNPDLARQLQNFVLDTNMIAVTDSTLAVLPADMAPINLNSLALTLRNAGDSHELLAQVSVNEQSSPSHLALTMQGEPGADFTASAYADTDNLQMLPFVMTYLPQSWSWQSMSASASVWAQIDQSGLQTLRGNLSEVQLQATEHAGNHGIDLQKAASGFAVTRGVAGAGGDEYWSVAMQDITFEWQQNPWAVSALQLQLPASTTDALTIRASELDLAMLKQITDSALPLPPRAASALRTLNPRGSLQNVTIATARDGSYPRGFLLRGNLRDVAVDAWQAAPSGSGIDGYVQADNSGGFVDLDSNDFTIHLPQLFTEAWHYDHINARVGWHLDNGDVRIQSSIIDLANASLRGRVQFELYNTRNTQNVPESDLSVLVGMLNMDVAARSAYLPTLPNLRETMTWLDAALQDGQLSNNGFILRTSTRRGAPPAAKTTVSWYNIERGRLEFLPEWPALEGITGHVEARDANVDVSTTTGSIAGMRLKPTTATVRPVATGGSLVMVDGAATTDTATGLEFLRTTPVHDDVGSFLDNWRSSGDLAIDVDLAIPLGANPDPDGIDIVVQSTDSSIFMPDYALAIDDIDGEVSYSNTSGLNAATLSARLFDAPVSANISTLGTDASDREIRVAGAGRVNMTALQLWPGQSEFVRKLLEFMPGDFDYSAELTIPSAANTVDRTTRLALRSDLVGVANLLPLPLSKSEDEPANVELRLAFDGAQDILNLRYGDFLSGEVVLDDGGIQRGQLFFGDLNRNFNIRQSDANAPGLLVNGNIGTFNFEEWQTVVDAFASGTDGSRGLADYLRLVDINSSNLMIFGQELEAINVQVRHENDVWKIYAENPVVKGTFDLPDADDQPWLVNLDYLRFPPRPDPEPGIEEEEVDLLQAVDPSTLPAFDFSTMELSIGPNVLGAFQFELRPRAGGASINDFGMDAADAHISNVAGTGGAGIDWRYANGTHSSSFNGLFAAGNLAQVLPAWGNDANVESTTASFSGNLRWVGSPVAFSLKKATGQLEMHITDGRFVDIEAGSTKLFGALNFDSLVRRLQLDFSDLFRAGFAFDNIDGNMSFNQGIVSTNDGIRILGPSSNITINGEIDLAMQTIAADMQVQIPLGQNISMLAGMLGAWPIALSTYIASKIFQEQMEDFTTIIYRLDGPWEAPEAGFEPPPEAQVLPESGPSSQDAVPAANIPSDPPNP